MGWLTALVKLLAVFLAQVLPPLLKELSKRKTVQQFGGDPDLKADIDAEISRVNLEKDDE